MFIRFFRSNQPVSVVVLAVFALLLWIPGFIHPAEIKLVGSTMPLFILVSNWLMNYKLLATLIALLLIILSGFILNYIINTHEILGKQSYMPALFYILLMSAFPALQTLHPCLFANIFLTLAIHQLFNTYRKDTAFSQIFNAGFLIAVASLFYLPAIMIFPLVWVALIVFRPFIWREWIIAFIGLIVPYIYLGVYYFWNEMDFYFWNSVEFGSHLEMLHFKMKGSTYFLTSMILLITILSMGKLFMGLKGSKLKAKNSLIVLLWFLFFSTMGMFFVPDFSFNQGYGEAFLVIPLSVFYANYFLGIKKIGWAEFLFLIFLTAIIVNQIIGR